MTHPAVFRKKGQSYSCITLGEDVKFVHFIPMETLKLTKVGRREFYAEWGEFPEYPVRRAAELYLGAGVYREIGPEETTRLKAIKAGSPAYNLDESYQPKEKEPKMATVAKKQPAATKGEAAEKPLKGAGKAAAPKAEKAEKSAGRPASVALEGKFLIPEDGKSPNRGVRLAVYEEASKSKKGFTLANVVAKLGEEHGESAVNSAFKRLVEKGIFVAA